MTDFFLVRHGETLWNSQKRYQGWKDSPLTVTGRNQGLIHGRLLAQHNISAIFASPLGRVQETLDQISQSINAATFFDARLKEINIGNWSGHTIDYVRENFPDEWEARRANPITFQVPGGESRNDLQNRVAPAVEEILATGYGKIAIVSHGITTRVILNHMLGLSVQDQLALLVPNECVYHCSIVGEKVTVSHYMNGHGPIDGLFFG
ncbi:MAG: histidine phosphatase family protein [Pseudomonadales bacterium]|nr:histidine phosphatase family protein [Pseudomonadales bacterium]